MSGEAAGTGAGSDRQKQPARNADGCRFIRTLDAFRDQKTGLVFRKVPGSPEVSALNTVSPVGAQDLRRWIPAIGPACRAPPRNRFHQHPTGTRESLTSAA